MAPSPRRRAWPSTSPTRARLVAGIKSALPQATWIEYTPVAQNRAELALGYRALPDYAKARRVLSLDADFLGSGDGMVKQGEDLGHNLAEGLGIVLNGARPVDALLHDAALGL